MINRSALVTVKIPETPDTNIHKFALWTIRATGSGEAFKQKQAEFLGNFFVKKAPPEEYSTSSQKDAVFSGLREDLKKMQKTSAS